MRRSSYLRLLPLCVILTLCACQRQLPMTKLQPAAPPTQLRLVQTYGALRYTAGEPLQLRLYLLSRGEDYPFAESILPQLNEGAIPIEGFDLQMQAETMDYTLWSLDLSLRLMAESLPTKALHLRSLSLNEQRFDNINLALLQAEEGQQGSTQISLAAPHVDWEDQALRSYSGTLKNIGTEPVQIASASFYAYEPEKITLALLRHDAQGLIRAESPLPLYSTGQRITLLPGEETSLQAELFPNPSEEPSLFYIVPSFSYLSEEGDRRYFAPNYAVLCPDPLLGSLEDFAKRIPWDT